MRFDLLIKGGECGRPRHGLYGTKLGRRRGKAASVRIMKGFADT